MLFFVVFLVLALTSSSVAAPPSNRYVYPHFPRQVGQGSNPRPGGTIRLGDRKTQRVKQYQTQARVTCPIILDGRVPKNFSLEGFDRPNGIFNPDFVRAQDVPWSQILKFPEGPASKFDVPLYKPVEGTIDDRSIFQDQVGFRRYGLQFANDKANDTTDTGVVTFHWSIKLDEQKKLNLSHEHLMVWHEAADFSSNQFNFNTGTRIGTNGTDKNTWQLLDRNSKLLWSVPHDKNCGWQNFALTLDYVRNTLTIYYSKGASQLKKAGGPFSNNNSGGGQFQIGILKKPTGVTGSEDITKNGFQPTGMKEAVAYGGLFVESSAGGCVSK
ncbi:uncharacterized protein IWZ02DRAFT_438884 [Phyllosticta citriasiana]|uniref:uncharacterized protein n=1 Tax=Phyllosticta citriasiana TaxID=595635 RepID=UPI0030FD33F2